jgi:hypothetical protein
MSGYDSGNDDYNENKMSIAEGRAKRAFGNTMIRMIKTGERYPFYPEEVNNDPSIDPLTNENKKQIAQLFWEPLSNDYKKTHNFNSFKRRLFLMNSEEAENNFKGMNFSNEKSLINRAWNTLSKETQGELRTRHYKNTNVVFVDTNINRTNN